jgi:UDP-N-acetylglucosamine/UDP-N-acetylgalactosamine diphosphorylase
MTDAVVNRVLGLDEARAALQAIGQEHLLTFASGLSPAELESLLTQISSFDLEAIPAMVEAYVTNAPEAEHALEAVAPPPSYELSGGWDAGQYRDAGEAMLSAGKVAAFTVAGGQGSRLGYDGPKGCYPGGAVTGKPLFACLADWLVAARSRYGVAVPWYVMTSPLNHEATTSFFEQHDYFGLDRGDVMFFQQGVLPSFDKATGRILLAEKGRVATNPDGHGGSLRALDRSGALADMTERGVEHVSYVQIDNPLSRVVDPVFLGLHATAPDSSGEMSTKFVAKVEPREPVGLLCAVEGKTQVIEYSDLPGELAEARRDDGGLRLRAGNTALHAIGVEFLNRVVSGHGSSLPYHRAVKAVPHVDFETGEPVAPAEPNAVKLELFVFDALPLASSSITYEIDRVDEFAPIKNAQGNDSPATSSKLQSERAARWLEARGVTVPRTADGAVDATLEISPVVAQDASELPESALGAIEPGSSVDLS